MDHIKANSVEVKHPEKMNSLKGNKEQTAKNALFI